MFILFVYNCSTSTLRPFTLQPQLTEWQSNEIPEIVHFIMLHKTSKKDVDEYIENNCAYIKKYKIKLNETQII